MTSEPTLTGEEEVVARPQGKEFSEAETQQAVSQMTFYGSSKWHEMTEKWKEEHPLKLKNYTPEEIAEADRITKEANETWKKLQEEKEASRIEAEIRRQKVVDEANLKLANEREKLIEKQKRNKKK